MYRFGGGRVRTGRLKGDVGAGVVGIENTVLPIGLDRASRVDQHTEGYENENARDKEETEQRE